MHVAFVDDKKAEPDWRVDRYSQHFACDSCGRSFEPLNPHHFSFNSPLGWCPACEGLGVQQGATPALLIRDAQRSLRDGAVAAWPDLTRRRLVPPLRRGARPPRRLLAGYAVRAADAGPAARRSCTAPAKRGSNWTRSAEDDERPTACRRFQYKGLFPAMDEASRVSPAYRQRLDHLVSEVPCSACGGSRLRDDAAACRFPFGGDRPALTLGELCGLPLGETLSLFQELRTDAATAAGGRRAAARGPQPAAIPGGRRPRLPDAGPAGADAVRRRDRSASAWPARSAAA